MATILLAWELGAGTGHCVNLKPIAEALAGEGHRVVFAARDLATARRVFGAVPVVYLQAPFLVSGPSSPIREPQTFAHILHNIGFGDSDQLQVLTSAWRSLFELIRPAIIVCEHAPTALLASRWTTASRHVLGTGFFSPPDVSPLPWIRPGALVPAAELESCEMAILDRVNDLLRPDGLPQLEYLARLYTEADANYLLTFPELDHYGPRSSAEYFGNWSPTGGLAAEWPAGHGPRVFAYLQPASSMWRLGSVLALLHEIGLPTIVHVAKGDPAWLEKFQSPRLRVVTDRVDIRSVARQSDLAILNGNAGTVVELLLAGIPQLLIPLHLEQAVNSHRVRELGAGMVARPDRPEQIAARLLVMLQESGFQLHAQAFAKRHADHDPDREQQRIVARLSQFLSM